MFSEEVQRQPMIVAQRTDSSSGALLTLILSPGCEQGIHFDLFARLSPLLAPRLFQLSRVAVLAMKFPHFTIHEEHIHQVIVGDFFAIFWDRPETGRTNVVVFKAGPSLFQSFHFCLFVIKSCTLLPPHVWAVLGMGTSK
mmetsp:Transcript_58458/g.117376  ORF Transcript_58458/g.117376 Transcript_58458/m.117376 type:complete len:140 (-) Transcript_58458:99-518(-)